MKKILILTIATLTFSCCQGQILDFGKILKSMPEFPALKKLKEANAEATKPKTPVDKYTERLLSFSENYNKDYESINNSLSKLSTENRGLCSERKFRYKNICLGMSIKQFSQVYKVFAPQWDAVELEKYGLENANEYAASTIKYPMQVECKHQSPSVYSERMDYRLPVQFRYLECESKTAETLLGATLERVKYNFMNGRLFEIVIYFNAPTTQLSGIRNYSDRMFEQYVEVKDFYQKWFDQPSPGNEKITLSSENIEKSDALKGPPNHRGKIIRMDSTWENSDDGTSFILMNDSKDYEGKHIKIYFQEVPKLMRYLEMEVSKFAIEERKSKLMKDF